MVKQEITTSDALSHIDLDMKIWKTELTFAIFLAVIIVFGLYRTHVITNIPCKNDILSIFSRNFIHISSIHLLTNLAGLIILYKVESTLGLRRFGCVFTAVLLLNTIIEWVLYQIFDLKCSIGLSGIIFGFAVFELVNSSSCTLSAIVALVAMLTLPSLKSSNVSIVGHLAGAFAGLIIALCYKYYS